MTPDDLGAPSFALRSSELFSQMNKVLRLRIGEKVILFNGDGNEYVSSIVSYNKNEVVFAGEEINMNDVSFKKDIFMFLSLVKKDNVEWIIQKGTELGVSHFIPLVSTRTEKKDMNRERINKIIIEATEQSGRNMPPVLEEVTQLKDIFKKYKMPFIAFQQGKQGISQEELGDETRIGILIGPEGGWTEEELSFFEGQGALMRSLGPTTLRAETAAIAAAALLLI